MDLEYIKHRLGEINNITRDIVNHLEPPPPVEPPIEPPKLAVRVNTAEEFDQALLKGGPIVLGENNIVRIGGFNVKVADTSITGTGRLVTGDRGSALVVSTSKVDLKNFYAECLNYQEDVIRIGLNTADQALPEMVPYGILIESVGVSKHLGKRAFGINAEQVTIRNCTSGNVYHPANLDSQGIWVGNSRGYVTIEDSVINAAAENIMLGGDWLKIPGFTRRNFIIRRCKLHKLLEYRDLNIPIKNILEIKDGSDVLIEECDLANCWKSAQVGYGFVFTPTQGGQVTNVLVKNCNMTNVSGVVNVAGVDAHGKNFVRTTVKFEGGTYKTNAKQNGGFGVFALLGRGPESFEAYGCDVTIDGDAFIRVGDNLPIDLVRIQGCRFNAGLYGTFIAGQGHGANTNGVVKLLDINNNTISGASSMFKKNHPNNTYV